MKCITNEVSKNFLNRQLRNRDGLHIIEMTRDDDDYIRYDQPIHRTIKIGEKIVDSIKTSTEFPIYFPINVICDATCVKHAQLIVIVCSQDREYEVLFFDSNGELDVFHEDGRSDVKHAQRYHYHDAILLNTISNGLHASSIQKKETGKRTRSSSVVFTKWTLNDRFQINKKIINPEGHCDAITLWFMHLNKSSKTKKDVKDRVKELQEMLGFKDKRVDLHKMKMETERINEEIRQLAMKRS
jgi:hypothetical protein